MGIRRTLNKSLLLPVFSLVMFAVIVLSVCAYMATNRQLEQRVENLAISNAVLFEKLLLQMNTASLQLLLDEHVERGVITAGQLTSGDSLSLKAGSITSGLSVYTYNHTLVRSEQDAATPIGTLTFQMSREGVLAQVRDRVLVTLLITSLAVMATVVFIQRLLNRRLIEPVLKIADGLESWEGDWKELELDLGRAKGTGKHRDDELDRLVNSIHGMRDQILSANQLIESKESRLLRAVNIAGIGFASYIPEENRYVECDDNFARMLGHTAEEVLGLDVTIELIVSRIHPEDLDIALGVRQRLQGCDGSVQSTLRIASPTGEYKYIRHLFYTALDENGLPRIVNVVTHDVTEFHRLQTTLAQAQKVKAIGNLTGGVAHDFNNILAIISGNLELLEDQVSGSLAARYVNTSLEAVQMGADLTLQLLAFARKQPLRPKVVNPSALIREYQSLLRTSVGESIELSLSLNDEAWNIEIDTAQLEASILNLIVNARDAMPDGGKLDIEVSNTTLDESYAEQHEELDPGEYVCIAISDTGSGMGFDVLNSALEPFYSTKAVGKGTGLGLPMVYGFAKQSGGHLKLYSELGHGTTVKLYIPRVFCLESENPEKSQESQSLSEFSGLHVFLVEDDDTLRETFTKQLERLGCVVYSAPDGLAAFALARQVPHIDLILCDVILPFGLKGPKVVDGLLKTYSNAAVVYMSGYTENAIIHQGRLLEGVTMLEKPFSMTELVAAFNSVARQTVT